MQVRIVPVKSSALPNELCSAIVFDAAKNRHPERWSGATRNGQSVLVVHLNPDQHIIEKDEKGDLELKMAA